MDMFSNDGVIPAVSNHIHHPQLKPFDFLAHQLSLSFL
jgi:hypothetical protein